METVVTTTAGKTINTDGGVIERLTNNNPFANCGGYEHMLVDKHLFVQCLVNAIEDAETECMLVHLLMISRSILSQSNEMLLIQKLVEMKIELINKK